MSRKNVSELQLQQDLGSESEEEEPWTFPRLVKEKPPIFIVREYFRYVSSFIEDENENFD